MAGTNGRPMKRHEACYWLNKVAEDARSSVEYYERDGDRDMEGEDEEKTKFRLRHNAERIAEKRKLIEALDVAGDALTR